MERYGKRPYAEIYKELSENEYNPKVLREIHKELKRDYNGGLCMFQRYPFLPDIVSVVALLVSILVFIATLFR